jgi:hypothetical protein
MKFGTVEGIVWKMLLFARDIDRRFSDVACTSIENSRLLILLLKYF